MKNGILHAWSIFIGGIFRTCYWAFGSDARITVAALERYKNARRKLPGVTKGPNGRSTRMGAYEAYQSTQEQE